MRSTMKYKVKKREKYYDDVIRLYFDENKSSVEISKIFSISPNTVMNWIRIFASERSLNIDSIMAKNKLNISKDSALDNKEIYRLCQELAKVKKELQREKLRADFYDEMINVAESKFNISIRKKAGAKQ